MEHEIQARYANHILTACQWLENTEKKICLFSQVSMVCDIGLILTAAGVMSYPELLGTVDNHVHIPTENHPMLFFFFSTQTKAITWAHVSFLWPGTIWIIHCRTHLPSVVFHLIFCVPSFTCQRVDSQNMYLSCPTGFQYMLHSPLCELHTTARHIFISGKYCPLVRNTNRHLFLQPNSNTISS